MASLPFIPSVTVNYPSSVMTLLILSLEQVWNKLQAKKNESLKFEFQVLAHTNVFANRLV